MKYIPPSHQFTLFDYNAMRPKTKVPISAARIKEVKELLAKRKGQEAAAVLREIREGLEAYEKRIR